MMDNAIIGPTMCLRFTVEKANLKEIIKTRFDYLIDINRDNLNWAKYEWNESIDSIKSLIDNSLRIEFMLVIEWISNRIYFNEKKKRRRKIRITFALAFGVPGVVPPGIFDSDPWLMLPFVLGDLNVVTDGYTTVHYNP